MKSRKKQSQQNTQGWLNTYADLVTLLLCFFVLLFSFSEVDSQKFQAILKSFQGSLGVFEGGKTIQDAPYINRENDTIVDFDTQEAEDFQRLSQYIEEYAEGKGLESKISTNIDERGLVIRVLDNLFFDSGRAELKPKAREVILYIGDILTQEEFKDKHIKIEGHTDTDRINTARFPSNWELSVIRATNVLRLLEEEKGIDGRRISASGYGPNRPVAPNNSSINKAKNRRVDIVILKSDYNKWEPN
ncbi:OmpA/MotB family protein [Clostridiisalibacter paucivorans]|uniref:OmpA/MotB family protein n=1 Tax=Clostridiisalibacter paucivorans TaxID=408753 RepID=UPI00047A5C05|nr:flagellar motor protein MotB [Clostridiisalibacter paucivorans]